MTWRLAESLVTLREQIDKKYPNRNKASDGTIGDAEHASRQSDHNPWIKDSRGVGVVTAIDITHDPKNGPDIAKLADSLVASRDPRIKYIIRNGQILVPFPVSWMKKTGWFWQNYTGANKHFKHIHISVSEKKYDDPNKWKFKEDNVSYIFDKKDAADVELLMYHEKKDNGFWEGKTFQNALHSAFSKDSLWHRNNHILKVAYPEALRTIDQLKAKLADSGKLTAQEEKLIAELNSKIDALKKVLETRK